MELLVKAREPVPFRDGAYHKGDIVEIRADGAFYGAKEGLPDFIVVKVPGLLMGPYRDYQKEWKTAIQFEVVSSDLPTDTHRSRLITSNTNVSGVGAVTREQVEAFITRWGGTLFSLGSNEVVFDISIMDALSSVGYWDIDVSAAVFNEVSYLQSSGVHLVDINYAALSNNPSYVETFLEGKVQTIISHADSVIRVEITRAMVRAEFEADIARGAKKMIQRRRYYIDPMTVDTIIGQGGVFVATTTQLTANLRDRLTE